MNTLACEKNPNIFCGQFSVNTMFFISIQCVAMKSILTSFEF